MGQAALKMTDEPRRAPRASLFLAATLQQDGWAMAVLIRNLSAGGAQIEGAVVPAQGSTVRLCRGRHGVDAVVVWQSPGQCGLRFEATIDTARWTAATSPTLGQTEVDQLIAEVRGEPAAFRAPCGRGERSALQDALPQRIAEELATVARMLDDLGEILAGEPLLVLRQSASLQNLDIGSQTLVHLARVLASAEPEQAIEAIGMDSLKRRLERKAL